MRRRPAPSSCVVFAPLCLAAPPQGDSVPPATESKGPSQASPDRTAAPLAHGPPFQRQQLAQELVGGDSRQSTVRVSHSSVKGVKARGVMEKAEIGAELNGRKPPSLQTALRPRPAIGRRPPSSPPQRRAAATATTRSATSAAERNQPVASAETDPMRHAIDELVTTRGGERPPSTTTTSAAAPSSTASERAEAAGEDGGPGYAHAAAHSPV